MPRGITLLDNPNNPPPEGFHEDFSLERVLDQLASQSNEPGLTAATLFRRILDTNNDRAHGVLEEASHRLLQDAPRRV